VLGQIGKLFLILGALLLIIGLALVYLEKINIPYLGRLPGDIRIEREGFTFYFPWVTFLLLSLVLTILINIILRLFGR